MSDAGSLKWRTTDDATDHADSARDDDCGRADHPHRLQYFGKDHTEDHARNGYDHHAHRGQHDQLDSPIDDETNRSDDDHDAARHRDSSYVAPHNHDDDDTVYSPRWRYRAL